MSSDCFNKRHFQALPARVVTYDTTVLRAGRVVSSPRSIVPLLKRVEEITDRVIPVAVSLKQGSVVAFCANDAARACFTGDRGTVCSTEPTFVTVKLYKDGSIVRVPMRTIECAAPSRGVANPRVTTISYMPLRLCWR